MGSGRLAGAALAAAISALPRLGSEFLPELNEGSLYITCTLPSNMSLTEGRKLAPRITPDNSQSPMVDEVLSQLGRPGRRHGRDAHEQPRVLRQAQEPRRVAVGRAHD